MAPAAASALAALTDTPSGSSVSIATTYADRAVGFRTSTLPVWLTFCGATVGLVTVGWLVGPLTGAWGFLWGWWLTSLIAALAIVSLAVWLAMWSMWHRDSPDAIASRTADARLRMAERWWNAELFRVYGGEKDNG